MSVIESMSTHTPAFLARLHQSRRTVSRPFSSRCSLNVPTYTQTSTKQHKTAQLPEDCQRHVTPSSNYNETAVDRTCTGHTNLYVVANLLYIHRRMTGKGCAGHSNNYSKNKNKCTGSRTGRVKNTLSASVGRHHT